MKHINVAVKHQKTLDYSYFAGQKHSKTLHLHLVRRGGNISDVTVE